ncbi:MAG: hypothetical protein ACHQVK_05330, partial [Candidatus Paceibacterales bacterium]
RKVKSTSANTGISPPPTPLLRLVSFVVQLPRKRGMLPRDFVKSQPHQNPISSGQQPTGGTEQLRAVSEEPMYRAQFNYTAADTDEVTIKY